jgi:hypothetical protein
VSPDVWAHGRLTIKKNSFHRAIDLALVKFAVETMVSFLAKVHGQSVLRHGQSFASNPLTTPFIVTVARRAGSIVKSPQIGFVFLAQDAAGTDQAISASFDRPGGAACNARVRLVELGA